MNRKLRRTKDVRKIFEATRYDEAVSEHLKETSVLKPEEVLSEFINLKENLSDSAYWYILGALWNSYPNQGTVEVWSGLFRSQRVDRKKGLMKPKELKVFKRLPPKIKLSRHVDETAFVYYRLEDSLDKTIITKTVNKEDIVAYFSHRNEFILLEKLNGLDMGAPIIDEDLGENVIERDVEHIDLKGID